MDRWACVNVRALPLQLLLAENPEWSLCPVAVVTHDTPQGVITWVNKKARESGINPGLRYAAALGLSTDLRAGVVSTVEIERGVAKLAERLQRFTPDVEPSDDTPGVFWLNAVGLESLYSSHREWARRVKSDLQGQGFRANIVVGFTRFGTYAISKIRAGVTVFGDQEREDSLTRQVRLDHLDLAPELTEMLGLLGIETVGEFLRLPAEGLRLRFGEDAHELYRRASGDLWTPLQPHRSNPPLSEREDIDHLETDSTRLLALIARLTDPLLHSLGKRGEVLARLQWSMSLDTHETCTEEVRPAEPTLDAQQILDLVRLRMESVTLLSGVEELVVTAHGVAARPEQLTLLDTHTHRDLSAADRALARIRAEFGEGAIVTAHLQDGHMPETRFSWEPLRRTRSPHPVSVAARPLVRRVFSEPVRLPRSSCRDIVAGPHIVSSGWWLEEMHREYHFAGTDDRRLLWVYYDRARRQWFAHGQVE